MRNLVGVVALLTVPLLAAQNIDIPFEKFVLPNGLTVLVHEDHKAPIVAINVWYHVGSKNEKPGKTGFAHLFEHLMFGGSENVKGRYIEAMEKVGATNLNGTTNEDRTNYFENVPTSAVDYALFAESDRMGHFYSTINKETLDLQRGVVQNEKRQGENQPYAVAYELIQKATHPAAHPYSHTVIGSMDDLNAASLDDVKDWFKTYYGPSNAVLVIAGDIDVKTAKEKVTKYFGDIPPGPPVAHPQSWVAKMSGEHRESVQDRVPQARLYKVWNVPEFGTATLSYLQLVADILGSGKSSRLYKRLVYDDQIATDIRVYVDDAEISSQFFVVATAKPGQGLKAVEAAVNEELDRFLKDGPTAAELDRARTQYQANFIRGVERIGGFGGKSDILATNQTYLGDASAYKDALKQVASATTGNLKDAADSWLSDGVYTLEVLPFTPQLSAAAKSVDRSKLPELGTPPELKLPKLQRDTLSNGLKIILAERHEIPIVDFWLTLDAGFSADHGALPGTASLTSALLTGGTAKRNALQISDDLQSLGAQLRASSDLDFTTIFLSALKTKLDPSLDLFADIVLNPSFPQTDFARQQKILLATIGQEKSRPNGMALRVMPPILYGTDNAYGVPFTGSGTTESVSKITQKDLVTFHQTWFKPNNATLIIVGDTTLAEIKPKLEQYFGTWKDGTVPTKEVASVKRPSKPVVYLIDKPGALQSYILTGTIAPAPVASIEPTYETMNDIYGGAFGARLNMNLREDKHWSYGAQSVILDARHQRPYLSFAPVQTDKTKESLVEMQKELTGIAGSKPITEAELAKAQDQEVLELPGSRETMQSIGNSIQKLLKFNFPDDYYQTYVKKVESLRPADVNDAAKSLISPQDTVWVIVGDRSKIEQGVRDLNIGEVKLIDADGNAL
jgi:zinc protease